MNRHNRIKLNHLFKTNPRGIVFTSAQLENQGISRQLVSSYNSTGWLEPIGKGAYVLSGSKVDWSSGLPAIQIGGVHVGGKTALELNGYGHFLPMGNNRMIHLFGTVGTRLPTWFQKYNWGNPIRYITTNFLPAKIGLIDKAYNNSTIIISSAERAILEVLHITPQSTSFEEVDLLMESLTTLRPNLLQQLLEKCNSIKVKRLFLFLAERHNFLWLKKLNLGKINLGKGKRVIVKGGHLNKRYQITVPKNFIIEENNSI
jgi:hypothetical protein